MKNRIKDMVIIATLALMICSGLNFAAAWTSDVNADDEIQAEFPAAVREESITELPVMKAAGGKLESSDELLGEYMMNSAGDSHRQVTRRSRLRGQEAIVYDILRENIDKVAAGTETSTVVNIPLSELGINQKYSAEELGLDTIFDESNPGRISEQARAALNQKFEVNLHSLLYALLGDCPYELYWYDKTEGISFSPPAIGAFSSGEKEYLIFENDPKATFSMTVSAAYGNGYATDTDKTIAASAAADNAAAIVEKHAGEADIDKLKSYGEEVMSLTDYNYDAVYKYEEDGIYGDPWQIIYVFDGDPSTKVVCEGYSKAFQFLCDLSEFSEHRITCNSIGGNMYSNRGSGAHMWNIVSVDDRNYLVDLTNSDGDDAPKNNELFLAGANGSVDDGYMIEWNEGNDWIGYSYDTMILYFYSEDELTLENAGLLGQNPDSGKASGAIPDKPRAVKVKAGKKKLTVSWEKSEGASYQIDIRKKGSKSWKHYRQQGTKRVIKKLKSKKYYYVKVRSCISVNDQPVYSDWSRTKKIKIK